MATRPRLTTRAHALVFSAALLYADAMANGHIDPDEDAMLRSAFQDAIAVTKAVDDKEALTFALARGIETPWRFDQLVNAARESLDELPGAA